jgi:DNA mismatch repair protein MutL
MPVIRRLPEDLVNRIAAGEVVERPSHLVKEIVENSLDAGATAVHVEFSQGGRFVKVSDNGQGIPRDDLGRALERFATSKISETADLWKLNTFGFRGEALASVAEFQMTTSGSGIADSNKHCISPGWKVDEESVFRKL